jgi:hypothetical protein
MVCQAQSVSTTCNCRIVFAANESENNLICFEDVCKELSSKELHKIIKSKVDDVHLNVAFDESNSNIQELHGESNIYVIRITYVATIENSKSNPELDNATLEAKLCDGVVYESSEYLGSNIFFYEPTVIQDDTTHTTSNVKWWIGKLAPGEKRTISLNVLYNYQEPPDIGDTDFRMDAQIWGKDIDKTK